MNSFSFNFIKHNEILRFKITVIKYIQKILTRDSKNKVIIIHM